jgi:ATP-dependent exoDNAse (exonuclease V) beta subunit
MAITRKNSRLKKDKDALADALLPERSLLYVAATRARDELASSWSGGPSDLLPGAKQTNHNPDADKQ